MLLLFANNSFAKNQLDSSYENRYCNKLNLGWDFYCDKEEQEKKEIEIKKPEKPLAPPPKELTPYEQILQIREKLNNLHALTILEPSEENIYNYEKFKLEQLDRVSLTTQATERVWWKYPELNYLLRRPVSTVAKQSWLDDRSSKIEETLQNLNKQYALIYFFRSDCIICKKFSPIVKSLSDDYQIKIRAVSIDGGKSNSFSDYKKDSGEAAKLGINAVPMLYLYDKNLRKLIEIGSGFLARTEIEERIYLITQVKIGEDY